MDHCKKVILKPIGLYPRYLREESRFLEVCAAISRYYNSGTKIPIDWIEEYNELVVKYPGSWEHTKNKLK